MALNIGVCEWAHLGLREIAELTYTAKRAEMKTQRNEATDAAEGWFEREFATRTSAAVLARSADTLIG